MDDPDMLSQTLNTMMNRHIKAVQNYEVEIANLIAELAKLQKENDVLRAEKQDSETRLAALIENQSKS